MKPKGWNTDFLKKDNLWEEFGMWILAFTVSFSFCGGLFLKADLMREYIIWGISLIGVTGISRRIILILANRVDKVTIYCHENNEKAAGICTLIFAINTMIYWIAFYPGNMFIDTYFQFTQIFGILPNGDWHPYGHTLFMKAVMQLCDDAAIIVFIQMVAMLYIVYRIFSEAAVMGYHPKFLYMVSVLLSLNLSYGLLIVNIWKDTLYTISLLYLFFFLYKNVDSDFTRLREMVIGILGFAGVLLFRHNGILVVLMVLFVLVVLSRWKWNGIVFSGAVLGSYFLFTTCVYSAMEVEPNAKITAYLPFLHGIAAVEHEMSGGGVESLDAETRKLMDALLPADVWYARYNPYNGDPLLFETEGVLQEQCEYFSIQHILGAYLRTFARHPFLIVKDRLASSELVWSVFPVKGSYNHIIGMDIHNSSFINDERLNQMFSVQEKKPNEITEIIRKCFYVVHDNVIFNIVCFRPAWLLWVLGFFMLCTPSGKRKKWLAVLPIYLNALSLLIAMNFQAFRYVWFVFECVPFAVLLLYGETIVRKKEE